MSGSAWAEVSGGEAVVAWFGREPHFHDGTLLTVDLSGAGGGTGQLRIHAWTMTNEVDTGGYFVLDRHAVVTLALDGVSRIDLTDVDLLPAIILDLVITRPGDDFRVEWDSSYGVYGSIAAKRVEATLEPGQPCPDQLRSSLD